MRKIPIFKSKGSRIDEWIFVDEEEYKNVYSFKWLRDKEGNVFRFLGDNKGPKKYLGQQILGKTPQSMYTVLHKDGDNSNYCRDNLLSQKKVLK